MVTPTPRWTPERIARVRSVHARPDYRRARGLCACGRHVVRGIGGAEHGPAERHGRRRCIDRRTGEVVRGARW